MFRPRSDVDPHYAHIRDLSTVLSDSAVPCVRRLKSLPHIETISVASRVVLLDQRGTGRSSGISAASLQRRGDPGQQAEYLSHFRCAVCPERGGSAGGEPSDISPPGPPLHRIYCLACMYCFTCSCGRLWREGSPGCCLQLQLLAVS